MHNRWILCGLGRLGKELYQSFDKAGVAWDLVCPSSLEIQPSFTAENRVSSTLVSWSNLKESLRKGDIVVLAVSDSKIHDCLQTLDRDGVTLIHCSGATELIPLEHSNVGVFYPLQTFSGTGKINWEEVPVFIEFRNDETETILSEFSRLLGVNTSNVKTCNSHQRLQIHLAAVFANNFTQTQIAIAEQLLKDCGVSLDVMLPILKQMAAKWGDTNSVDSITGPAVRGDNVTIEKHLKALEAHPNYKKLYMDLTEIIKQLKS